MPEPRRKLVLLAKIAAAILGFFLLILAIAPFILEKYFPPEKIKSLIVENARKAVHREVRLGGVSLGLWKGLTLEDLAVSELPDFKAGTFVSMKSFGLKIRWLPLLHKKIVVDTLSADSLDLTVVKRRDGLYNFSDIAGSTSTSAAPASASGGGLPFALDVSRASLSSARVSYKDLGTGDSAVLSDLDAGVRNFRLKGPFTADLSLKAAGRVAGRSVDSALSFSGKVDLGGQDPKKASADVKKLSLDYAGLKLQASGTVKNLSAPQLDVQASVASRTGRLLSAQFSGSAAQAPLAVQGDFKAATPGFDSSDLKALGVPEKIKVPAVEVSGKIDMKDDNASVRGLRIKSQWGTADIAGTVAALRSKKPVPDLDAAVKLEVPETKAADVPFAKLPAGAVVPAFSLDAKLHLKGDDVSVGAFHLKTKAGTVDASGTVRQYSGPKPKPDLDVAADLNLPELKAADIPMAKLPAGLVVPALSVETKAHLAADDVLLSAFHLKTKAGTVDASGSVRQLSSAKPQPDLEVAAKLDLPELKAADIPMAKLPEGMTVPALSIDAKARLKNDDVTLDAFHLKTKAGSLDASGTARRLTSAKPEANMDASVRFDLPEIKGSDVPFAKLPEGFVSPAASVNGKFHAAGEDLTISSLHVKTKAGTVDVSGAVKGATTGKPEPNLDVAAKLDLPAFTSKDVPYKDVPPGLSIPASKWEASLSGGMDQLSIKSLRVVMGSNDVDVSGKAVGLRGKKPIFNVLVKCRSFKLEELTQLTQQTRDMNLTGNGFFALGFSAKNGKPIVEGKMLFRGLGATVAGLKLADFTGTAKFDERRIDIPNLTGKVADGTLNMDFTVKNYATSPELDLQASLDEFDLGKFMAAQKALSAEKPAAAAAAPGEEKKAPPPIDARGKFTVGKLMHPNAEAKNVEVDWDLTGITPDFKSLNGQAKLSAGGGKFHSIGDMATQSKIVKVLISPLLVIQKISSLGGIRLFPDFNNVTFTEIAGDYRFKDGVMTLADSHLYSDAFTVVSEGQIDLASEKLALLVTAKVASVAPIPVAVTGTFAQPKYEVKYGQFLKQLFVR